jgi:hypothetical protein
VSQPTTFAAFDSIVTWRLLQLSGEGGIVVNTERAQRLAYRAWKKGGQSLQQTVISNLFQALTIDNKDISNNNVLSKIAEASCLMSKNEVRPTLRAERRLSHPPLPQAVAYLTSDQDAQAVEDQIEEARKGGISGVPVVIIEGKWAISGGQTRDVYLQVNYLSISILDRSPLTYDPSLTTQVFKKLAGCKGFIDNTCSPESTAKALSAKIVA